MEDKFMVEISARHCHLSKEDFYKLFGEGKELTPMKDLSQPNQYASEEKVTLVGPKGSLSFRILGPFRDKTQFEISLTEARILGIDPVIRESGFTVSSPGGTIVGPNGDEVEIESGVIVAKRHIHMSEKDAENYGVKNQDIVAVRIESEQRSLIFEEVVIRVSPNFRLAMHIDTDEANAAGISFQGLGEIVSY